MYSTRGTPSACSPEGNLDRGRGRDRGRIRGRDRGRIRDRARMRVRG